MILNPKWGNVKWNSGVEVIWQTQFYTITRCYSTSNLCSTLAPLVARINSLVLPESTAFCGVPQH